MTRIATLVTAAMFMAINLSAQEQHGGTPNGWGEELTNGHVPGRVGLSALPPELIDDVLNTPVEDGRSFRFGTQRPVNVDVIAQGTVVDLPDGRRVIRTSIHSPGAAMLSLQFSAFRMGAGAQLFLYDAARTTFLGAFTEQNELPTGRWATQVIPGDEIVIEYISPSTTLDPSAELRIEGVTHGVVDIFHLGDGDRDYYPGYAASPCQVNIACPQGAGWAQVASSTALFLRPDGHGCTGALVNNTRNDGTPYFYLANHCNLPPHDQWVFYFNYQAPNCVGDTGQTVETVVGSTLRAADHYSDFTLLELFTPPQQNYDVFYTGWDRTNNVPQSGTVIGHAAYDVKKIIRDTDPVVGGLGTTLDPNVATWVTQWDEGFAEFGTSGSALLDHNKRVVGLVTESWGDCSSLGGVSATRFSEQWDGPNANQRLRDWLDPDNLGNTVLNGHDPNPPVTVIVPIKIFLEGPFNAGNSLMNNGLRASGSIPLIEPYGALGFTHVGEGGMEQTTAAVLAVTGSNAIVDWVFVELRDKNDPTLVVSTHAALLKRNGNVVGTDGTSALSFQVPHGDHYLAVKHRNHLGIMTNAAIALSDATVMIDLTNTAGPALFGGNAVATNAVNGIQVMIAGDAHIDQQVMYTGANNDRDAILTAIGGLVPTLVVAGYLNSDTNLDGLVKYAGPANDRDVVLRALGGVNVNVVRTASLP